jgi:uncharacterized membrane protein YgcG
MSRQVGLRLQRVALHPLLALLAALAVAFTLPATAHAQGKPRFGDERISHFHSDIVIARDGSLDVTETIEVEALGHEIRRGILRDFPTDYRDRAGNRVNVPFDVRDVTRNGAPERWQTESMSNGVRVRIGNPDALLTPGTHRYVIRYRTARQLGFFDKHDELYWNVTGNGWTLPIIRATATVTLPQAVEAAKLSAESYYGAQGDTLRGSAEVRDGAASFASDPTRMLMPREGLTVVLAFPKGLIPPPSARDRIGWFVSANKGAGVGLIGTVLLALALALRWRAVGRDPKAGPLFPRYEPSPGLSAGGARYVDRMQFDARCFAAGVLHLGARGFLRVEQQKDGFTVTSSGRSVPWLAGDRPLADALFASGSSITFSKTYDPKVEKAQKAYRDALTHHYNGVMFSRNTGTLVLATLVALAIAIGSSIAGGSPLLVTGIAVMLVAVLFIAWRLMPAYSVPGRKLRDEIEGLRQYLGVAERASLARMQAPELTPQEFARMLPFALALGVEKTWADRFATVAGAAAVAAAVDSYYHGDDMDGFTASSLGSSLGDLSSTVSSASSPPGSSSGSSSNGGGGGSSGGGGGGGGGSGW